MRYCRSKRLTCDEGSLEPATGKVAHRSDFGCRRIHGGIDLVCRCLPGSPGRNVGIKVGERDDELRKQLLKAQAEIQARVTPEAHNVVLGERKGLEAKLSRANQDLDKLRTEIKENDGRVGQFSKELEEAKATLGKAMRDLQSAKDENHKLSLQINELKKTFDASVLTRKKIQAFVQELARVEFGKEFPREGGTIEGYNVILRSLKKELPNDSFVQTSKELDVSIDWRILAPMLGNTTSQMRGYLETTYLK